MSVYSAETLPCPNCKATVQFNVLHSLNADRRPSLRDAVLDGSLQRGKCKKCGFEFRMSPELNYVDVGRGQWIAVFPPEQLASWSTREAAGKALFAQAYGPGAPPPARAIAAGLSPRLVFGWPALREKLIVGDLGLDDAVLELVKLAWLRSVTDPPIADDVELRLFAGDAETLHFAWVRSGNEAVLESLEIPRSVYNDVVAALSDWSEIYEELKAGSFVDMNRMLVAPAEA